MPPAMRSDPGPQARHLSGGLPCRAPFITDLCPCGPARAVAVVCAALSILARPAEAQEPPAPAADEVTAERCMAAEHRQFDFWIGRWDVRNAEGELIGHNEISRIAGGCGLLEEWQGLAGGRGSSVNTYDADRGRWTQRWVGTGATLWLEGGLEEGAMVLTGTSPRNTPGGEVLDRITWTPLPGGGVRQTWEISRDGGLTWTSSFVGVYTTRPMP